MEEINKTKISSLPLASSFQTGDEVVFRRGTKAWRAAHSLLKGDKGNDIYLRQSGGYIQWKSGQDGTWTNLIAMSELKGDTGKSAYELWKAEPGNANKTYEDYLAFNKQPATEAAAEVRQEMNDIKEEWNELYKPEVEEKLTEVEEATGKANIAADSVKDGKTPVILNAPTSQVASDLPAQITLTLVGTDENGNPIYRQDASIPKAKIPIHVGKEAPIDPDIIFWIDTVAYVPLSLTGTNMRLTNNSIRL